MNSCVSDESVFCDEIKQFVKRSKYNTSKELGIQFFDEPIIQFASIENPLFETYKEIIGSYHLTPKQVLLKYLKDSETLQGSVISIVLPISEKVRESNREETDFGSKEWAVTRYYGDEIFIDKLQKHIIKRLESMGYYGIAPSKSDMFEKIRRNQDISSNWSERHIAYAAGLGTFSINDAFITEKGIAVKLVSIVTDAVFTQSKQEYENYRGNCLWAQNKTCGACMKRCPVGAITEQGHDKLKCFMHCYGEESQRIAKEYGGNATYGSGCGLCQTKVPCEYQNPMKLKR